MKLELGGGASPRSGFHNVDILPSADTVFDLNTLGPDTRLPFPDNSVQEVYSSHCFEHLANLHGVLNEIVRVCQVGVPVEIRVPHWASAMAHCLGHFHAFSDEQVLQLVQFQDVWWPSGKMLTPTQIKYVPSRNFKEASRLWSSFTPLQIVKFVQDTCFEIRFSFKVTSTGNAEEKLQKLEYVVGR
jgi:ubiquinone/menaquinone biosynthesis C-methylase UbiE